jgi:hypothetical protein
MRQDLADVYSLTRTMDGGYRVGNIPLVVLTKSPNGPPGPLDLQHLNYNDQLGDDLAHASPFDKHVVASTSDHHIQLTEPDLVTNAIRDTVATAVKVRTARR